MTTSQHDRDPRTHAIISAAFDVHKEVGAGSYGEGVVEIKSLPVRTGKVEQAQMLKYLRASGLKVALLLNFGLASLEYRRFVMGDWKSNLATFHEVG